MVRSRSRRSPTKATSEADVHGSRRPFLDRDIAVGDSWRKRIAAELNQARAIVVLLSAAAVESDWVCGETQFAQKKGKAIRMTLGTDVAIYPDFSQLKLPSPTEEMRSSSVV